MRTFYLWSCFGWKFRPSLRTKIVRRRVSSKSVPSPADKIVRRHRIWDINVCFVPQTELSWKLLRRMITGVPSAAWCEISKGAKTAQNAVLHPLYPLRTGTGTGSLLAPLQISRVTGVCFFDVRNCSMSSCTIILDFMIRISEKHCDSQHRSYRQHLTLREGIQIEFDRYLRVVYFGSLEHLLTKSSDSSLTFILIVRNDTPSIHVKLASEKWSWKHHHCSRRCGAGIPPDFAAFIATVQIRQSRCHTNRFEKLQAFRCRRLHQEYDSP